MARARQLFLTLASSSALYSGLVPALGLGEISLHSALNQPLNAEITLLDTGDLTADELRIGLASVAAFQNAGVDRLQFLDDLRFTPLFQGNHAMIRVTSNKPVREPYLNFIVAVQRANGRLLREYTLLIDPPTLLAERSMAAPFSANAAPAQQTALQLPIRQGLPRANQGKRYQVRSGDSLWKIAKATGQDASHAFQLQLMADIHALNPQAFVGGDINRLKAGVSLLLPDDAAASAQAPVTDVAAIAPTSALELPQVPATAELIAMQRRLDDALAGSELDRLQLQQQLIDLQVQLTQLQLQVEAKDQQVSELQTQMAEAATVATPAPAAAVFEEPIEPIQLPAEPALTKPLVGDIASKNDAVSRYFIWLAGGVFALFAGGLLWWRQRGLKRQAVAATAPLPAKTVAAITMAMPGVVRAEVAATTVLPGKAEGAPVGGLEEANIYIAYGRLPEARDVLLRLLEQAPERAEVRLRLLAVLGELGDSQRFAEHEQGLSSPADHAEIERIKRACPQLGDSQLPDLLEDVVLDLAVDESVQLSEVAQDEELPLNLDDLSLDADWSLISPFDPAPSKAGSGKIIEAQFRSDLKSLPEVLELSNEPGAYNPFPLASRQKVDEDQLDDVFEELPSLTSSSLDDLAGSSENLARLNMALAYIEQGSLESACNILNQVLHEGDPQQQQQAREILQRIA